MAGAHYLAVIFSEDIHLLHWGIFQKADGFLLVHFVLHPNAAHQAQLNLLPQNKINQNSLTLLVRLQLNIVELCYSVQLGRAYIGLGVKN